MEMTLNIGGLRMAVDSRQVGIALSRAYDPFIAAAADGGGAAGTLHILAARGRFSPSQAPVAVGFNDLGQSRLFFDGHAYIVGISPMRGEEMRYMRFSPDFREAELMLAPGSRWNSFIADSMLRIFFSQIAVLERSFLVHASAVATPSGAHIFMGKSGTGKSTHSALWLRNFPDCSLLNDDNPLVRLAPGGSVTVHGTPWSGKTKCWRDASAPLLSMTRLRQAKRNAYAPLADVGAFVSVLPGVSVISHSRMLHGRACDTLASVVGNVRVGVLDCLPDSAAALLCRQNAENIKNSIITNISTTNISK